MQLAPSRLRDAPVPDDAAAIASVHPDAQRPWALAPVRVEKAWGAERWYTGIERRGVARLRDGAVDLPLDLALDRSPALTEGSRQPLLVKRLEPRPEPGLGDLYFEMHRRKHEVYVVTDVDLGAWPDGAGRVRLGLSVTPAEFLAAVRRYRDVRRRIDTRIEPALDAARGRGETITADLVADAIAALPPALGDEEQASRLALAACVRERSVRMGDVVVVPPNVPHGLLHGVEVLEFQNPDYERRILYAHQPLLTGGDWETEAALHDRADAATTEQTHDVWRGPGVEGRRLARTPSFDLWRLDLAAGARLELGDRLPAAPYGVLLRCAGTLSWQLGGRDGAIDEAMLMPRAALRAQLRSTAGGSALLALAREPHA